MLLWHIEMNLWSQHNKHPLSSSAYSWVTPASANIAMEIQQAVCDATFALLAVPTLSSATNYQYVTVALEVHFMIIGWLCLCVNHGRLHRWSSDNRPFQVAGDWLFSLFVLSWLLLIRIMFVTNGFAVTVRRSRSLAGDLTTQQAILTTHVSNRCASQYLYCPAISKQCKDIKQ